MPLPPHIAAAEDLVTSHADVRAGFIRMALEKNARATPHVAAGRALRARALQLGNAQALITEEQGRPAILSASGLSDKALSHLNEEDKAVAVAEFVHEYIEPAGEAYADELTFRYLLTKGDALGGQMRNVAGRVGDQRFLTSVLAALSIRQKKVLWRDRETKEWKKVKNPQLASQSANGLQWKTRGKPRTLLLNVKVPLVNKNVDSVLLSCTADQAFERDDPFVKNPHFYVALGELKGGIDPAGADEHWKTANHTLSRIAQAFAKEGLNPKTYFVGAAIAAAMASEIIEKLRSGQMTYTANLMNEEQLAAFSEWFVSL